MADVLKSKKVAILAADMFERVELEQPRKALEDAGAEVEIVSIHDGEIQGFDHFDLATTVKVDRTVEDASADDYDALLVPGGVGNPDQLRGDENAVAFVRATTQTGRIGSPGAFGGGVGPVNWTSSVASSWPVTGMISRVPELARARLPARKSPGPAARGSSSLPCSSSPGWAMTSSAATAPTMIPATIGTCM